MRAGVPLPALLKMTVPPINLLAEALHSTYSIICKSHALEECPYRRSKKRSVDFDTWAGRVYDFLIENQPAAQPAEAVRDRIVAAIAAELQSAYTKHGALPWGRHEFYAILREEVDELWDAIKADDSMDRVAKEAVQVAAMVIRYLETGDRYQGRSIFMPEDVDIPDAGDEVHPWDRRQEKSG